MEKKTKEALTKALAENLPANLTEEQARFWVDNPECLAGILENLATIVVYQHG